MRISRKKLRRAVFAILFLVTFNSFGIGWWWMANNYNNNDASGLQYSGSSHVRVPHPFHHMAENRWLHNKLHNSNEVRINNINSKNENENPKEEKKKQKQKQNEKQRQKQKQERNETPIDPLPPVPESLLNCSNFGGPYDYDSVEEMVYWKDIPQDLLYRSRFSRNSNKHNSTQSRRFLTFDTDLAGFNNERMVFEINVVTAIVTGRTLVIPRDRDVSHLHTKSMSLSSFFNLKQIAAQMRYNALDIMTMDEFIYSEGGPDKLHIPSNFTGFYERTATTSSRRSNGTSVSHANTTKGTEYNYHDKFLLENMKELGCDVHRKGKDVCSNYTDWIEQKHAVYFEELRNRYYVYFVDEYLTNHPKVFSPQWGTQKCLLTIPDHYGDKKRFQNKWIKSLSLEQGWFNRRTRFQGSPVALNAAPEERLAQVYWNRKGLCVYSEDIAQNDEKYKYWHMQDRVIDDSRLVGHWYDYIFFEDWKEDLWVKRFVRDKMRYNEVLQCAAARIVQALRQAARDGSGGHTNKFHTMHIRRTDLTTAYKDYGVDKDASHIYHEFSQKRNIVPNDSIVYIATDESNKKFFQPFLENYKKVYFLDDFIDLLGPDIPGHYYGMIEQLVCSRGEHFVGTFYSTFTGYINRLRGYHSQKFPQQQQQQAMEEEEKAILEQGVIPSWFYAPPEHVEDYQKFTTIGATLFEIDYAMAWRNIDYDVDPVLRNKIDKMEEMAAAELLRVTKTKQPQHTTAKNSSIHDEGILSFNTKPIHANNSKIKANSIVGLKNATSTGK